MSRYFFHIMDGQAVVDTHGTELGSIAEARVEAAATAARLLADMDGKVGTPGANGS